MSKMNFIMMISLIFLSGLYMLMGLEMYGLISLTLIFLMMMFLPAISTSFYFSEYFFIDQTSLTLIYLTMLIFSFMPLNNFIFMFNNIKMKFIITFFLQFVLMLIFTTTKPILFYMMFELSLIPIFLIIMGWGYQIERLSAGTAMIMYTVSASLPLMAVILFMMQGSDSMDFTSMKLSFSNNSYPMFMIALMTTLGFLIKFPIFLGHLWLPKAHVEAPASGSMILAAILLKLGGYGMIRFSEVMNKHDFILVVLIALWGGMVSSIICVQNLDMKIVVAYSSVAHMAIVIAALCMMTKIGLVGALILMVAHGLSSSGLFFYVGLMTKYSNSRSLIMNKSLLMMSPYSSLIWFVIVASGMGVPPTLNFVGEVTSMTSFISDYLINGVMGATMIFMAGAYSLVIYSVPSHAYFYLQSVKKASYLVSEKLLGALHGAWVFVFLLFMTMFD